MIVSDAHFVSGNKRQSRIHCLASTSLCSVALVAVLMQISEVRAADLVPPFNGFNNTITQNTGGNFGNVIVIMQDGNDTYRVNATVNANQNLNSVGGAGNDTFQILGAGQLNVTGTSQFVSTERLINAGIFNTGALTYTGTVGDNLIDNSRTINVTGAATFNTGAGADTFNNRQNSRLLATGTITLDGGSGVDELRNDGRIEAVGPTSDLVISNYEIVNNSFVLKAGGDVTYTGTAGDDLFTNSGIVFAGGNATFGFGAGNDRFINTGIVDVKGDASFDGGAGTQDGFFNGAGAAITAKGEIAISNFEAVVNNGGIEAVGDLKYTGSANADTFTNGVNGTINVTGNGIFSSGGGIDTFTNNGLIDIGGGGLFDGGAGTGDTFINTASGANSITVGGLLLIKQYESVRNVGAITANGGFGYSGSGTNDTFTNEANGVITVSGGNATLDGLTGADRFTNDGRFIVQGGGDLTVDNIEVVRNNGIIRSEGNAAFDGGAAGTNFSNTGFVDVSGNLTIDNFTNTVNLGRIDVDGGLTYSGTSGGDAFGNGAAGIIKVSGGDAVFHGEGGADALNNAGVIKVTGAGGALIVDGMENVTNTGTILSVGAASFSGGAAGGTFANTGTLTAAAGLLTVEGYTTTANTGTINASGGLAYTGTGGVDAFNNFGGGSIIVANGDALLDGRNGADTFTNSGTFRVTGAGNDLTVVNIERMFNQGTLASSGAATFQGGAAGARFDNSGTIGVVNTLTIASYLTTANTGAITAGGLNYVGTGGVDVFGNGASGVITVNGNGVFNSGAGNDRLINAGTMSFTGTALFDGAGGSDTFSNNAGANIQVTGETRFANFELVTNNGTMLADGGLVQTGAVTDRFVNNGTLRLTGNGILSGDLSNAGTFDMGSRAVADEIGQIVKVGGNFNAGGGTVRVDTNLAGVDGQGVSDSIRVAGNSTGTLNLALIDRQSGTNLLYSNPLSIVSSGGGNLLVNVGGDFNNMTLANGSTALLDEFGFIDYNITSSGGDVFVNSRLDTAEAGGVAGGVSSTLSAISAIFHKPSSAFLSSCKQGNDGRGFGSWGRAAGGSLDTDISGTSDFGDLRSKNTTNFTGLQGGFDTQFCDVGEGKAVIHTGVTVGNIKGDSTQTNGGFDVDFDSYFAGAYGAFIQGSFSADVLLRYDSHHFDLNHDNNDIIAPGTTTDGNTLSAMAAASYRFSLTDTLLFTPSAGVTVSRTSVDSFDVNNGSEIRFDDLVSVMGFAGGNIQKTFQVNDTTYLLPFLSLNVYNEFGDGGSGLLSVGNVPVSFETDTVGTFGQIGAGVNFFVLGGEGATEPNVVGGARFDTQFGESLQGWALTGNVRLQF